MRKAVTVSREGDKLTCFNTGMTMCTTQHCHPIVTVDGVWIGTGFVGHVQNVTLTVSLSCTSHRSITQRLLTLHQLLLDSGLKWRSSLSSWFQNCPRPQLAAAHFWQPQPSIAPLKAEVIYDRRLVGQSWCQAPIWELRQIFLFLSLIIFRQIRICLCGTPSPTRSRVCSFQLLLRIASATYLSPTGLFIDSIFETPPPRRAWGLLTQWKSKLLYEWRSGSQYVLVSIPLWDLCPDITSCVKVAVWKLLSCSCGAPSLTRGRVCSL
jgi:hypothetical protein